MCWYDLIIFVIFQSYVTDGIHVLSMVCNSHCNCMTNKRPTICGLISFMTLLFSLEETETSARVLWHKFDYSISHRAVIDWILMYSVCFTRQTGRYAVTSPTSSCPFSVVLSLISSKSFYVQTKNCKSTLTFGLVLWPLKKFSFTPSNKQPVNISFNLC